MFLLSTELSTSGVGRNNLVRKSLKHYRLYVGLAHYKESGNAFQFLLFIDNKMASLAAALLDELMGRNRNALPTDRTKELSYNDAEVIILNFNFLKNINLLFDL